MQLFVYAVHTDGLMQERRNSIANALELGLSSTNPSTYWNRLYTHGPVFITASFVEYLARVLYS